MSEHTTLKVLVVLETVCLVAAAIATEYHWVTAEPLQATVWLPMALALACSYVVVFLLYYAAVTELFPLLIPYILFKILYLCAATALLVVVLTCYERWNQSTLAVPILSVIILAQFVLSCTGLGYAMRHCVLGDPQVKMLPPAAVKSRRMQTDPHIAYAPLHGHPRTTHSEAVTQTTKSGV